MRLSQPITLILVRHTQTPDNVDKIYSGQRDIPLNDVGIVQARELAEQLKGRDLIAIYASDLDRTRTVSEMIASHHPDTPLSPDARLRELDMGRISGMTKADALIVHPEPHLQTSHPDYDFSSVGGETRRGVVSRQIALLREIDIRHGDRSGIILLVGHGTALQNLLQALGFEEKLHAQGGFTEITLSDLPDES